jgi:replicative DNA helicase
VAQPETLAAVESALVGALLLDPSRAGDVGALVSTEDVQGDAVRAVLSAILCLDAARQPIDVLCVAAELERRGVLAQLGGRTKLYELTTEVVSSAHVLHHARLVSEASTLRRLARWAREKADEAAVMLPQSAGVAEYLEDAERELLELTRRRTLLSTVPVHLLVDEIEAGFGKGGLVGRKSGLIDFDTLTNGLKPGQLVVAAGRPGMGKTGLACRFAEEAALGPNAEGACYFSLEMDPRSIVERVLAARARVSTRDIERGSIPHARRAAWDDAAQDMRQGKLLVSSRSRSVPSMRGEVRRWKQKHGLALVVVDYLQLMRGGKSDNRQEEVAGISRDLKELAVEFNVPVLAMAQLNRLAESRADKKPMLSDLRESGAIEQDADIVVLLFRADYYRDAREQDNRAELIVAKHRNGPTGTIDVGFDAPSVRFFNLAPKDMVAFEGSGIPR